MVQNRGWLVYLTHGVLILGVVIVAFPIYVAFVASTHELEALLRSPMPLLPGAFLLENYSIALSQGAKAVGAPVWLMMLNSLVMAIGITFGKIAISLLAAFAIVYFRFRFRMLFFWMIFVTLMLPVEVRILPTYKVVADLGLLNSYPGLIIPLIASATATFMFRQVFLAVPDELAEAARIDGAGPLRFFWDILIPLSRTNIAALFVILFISSLSFLGLGVQPPVSDWGSMVRENLQGLGNGLGGGALACLAPAFAIATVTIAINLIVDDISAKAGGSLAKKMI